MGLVFNGSNTGVSIADGAELDASTGLTVIAWLAWSTLSGDRYALCKGGDLYDLLCYNANHGKLHFYITTSAGAGDLLTVNNYNDGTLRMFAGVFDSSLGSNQQKIYVNAVLENQQTRTGNINVDNNPLTFGRYSNPALFFWNGSIFEVRVYKRALSLAEIQEIYNGRGVDTVSDGLRWTMDESYEGVSASGAGSILDRSGQGYNGSPVNSPVYKNPAVVKNLTATQG